MFNWVKRDRLIRPQIASVELQKNLLKSLIASSNFDWIEKVIFSRNFKKYNFFNSISCQRSNCVFTGWARSVFKMFKLSRHQVKQMASNGLVNGLRKSSF